MELINRYVAEVGRHLPEKSRTDIENELRSLLEDMLEDRASQAGRPADEEMEVSLLKEYGNPQKVAASYLPPRYLVGPRLYPTFMMALKIVVLVISVLSLVRLGIGIAQPMQSPAEYAVLLGEVIQSLVTGMISGLGSLVIVFAILQRALPEGKLDLNEWDPKELKVVVEDDRVRSGGQIAGIIFSVLFILLLNFYPGIFAFHWQTGGKWISIPILSAAFFHYVPWITAIMLLKVGLDVWVLRQGSWQPLTRWLEAGLNAADIALLVVMVSGPSLVSIDTNTLPQALRITLEPRFIGGLAGLVDGALRLALTIAVVVETIELARTVYRMLTKKVASL